MFDISLIQAQVPALQSSVFEYQDVQVPQPKKATRVYQGEQGYGIQPGSIYYFASLEKPLEDGDIVEGEVQTPDGNYKVTFIATIPSSEPSNYGISEDLNEFNDKIFLAYPTKKKMGIRIGSTNTPFFKKSPYINWMKVNGVFVEFD